MTSPSITVLLATYNGARYLPEQLASLAAQTLRPDRLVVRDDGSTDDGLRVVRDWGETQGIPVQWVPSTQRLGPAQSFLAALRAVGVCDVTLFCDQDDVWLPHKVERAARALATAPAGTPRLYASRLEIVDQTLAPLGLSPMPRHLGFETIACESVLTGCTMAFNAPLAHLLASPPPDFMVMHDWWSALLAAGCGDIVYDPEPTLRYRQHASNTLGAGPTGLRKLQARLATFLGPDSAQRSRQLRELLRLHAAVLRPSARRLAEQLTSGAAHPARRVRAALAAPLRRQSSVSTLSTRLSLLINRF